MSEHVQEAEFQEVRPEGEGEQPEVRAQVLITLLENGALNVGTPDGMPELKEVEVEGLARQVADQLRDVRVANSAIEIFKQRLG